MSRSRWLPIGLSALMAVLVFTAGPAKAEPPMGMSKMWPWNVNPNAGYNEPPNRPSASVPGQPPLPPRKYQVLVYTLPQKTSGDEANRVELVTHMPADGDIWFEDAQMPRKNVKMREFISPPLTPGKNYVYNVRVNWAEEGHRAEQSLKVPVQAGEVLCLDLRPVENKDVQAGIRANLDKLSPEDRKLAEEQGFCGVQVINPLGSMGVPVKVLIKDQPVFLCCKGCEEKAKKDPEATLARLKEAKETKEKSKEAGEKKPGPGSP
jgi:uncharacterized protein (TIGR03000 family)